MSENEEWRTAQWRERNYKSKSANTFQLVLPAIMMAPSGLDAVCGFLDWVPVVSAMRTDNMKDHRE